MKLNYNTKLYNALFKMVCYFDIRNSKLSFILYYVVIFKNKLFNKLKHFGKSSSPQNKLIQYPVEWLDENKDNLRMTLESEKPTYSYGPLKGSQRIEPVLIPSVNLYYFENARVCSTSSSILLDNKIIIERVKGVDVERCDFTADYIYMHDQKMAMVCQRPTYYLDKGIFLGGNGSFNYYHWMIEILPKLKYLQNIDEEGYQTFPLLLSEDLIYVKTFREALNLIVKNRSIIILDKNITYFIGNLLYINSPNTCPFNLRENQKIKVSDFFFRKSSINFLRDQLSLDLEYVAENRKKRKKRIFLARHGGRRTYNQDEIFKIFEIHGFTKVFMEKLSLKDQIKLIRNTEMMAGPSGAAWTNIIFCSEGTKCLCWMADVYLEFSAYSNLARIVGADLRYVTHKTLAKSTHELYFMHYHVDKNEVERELHRLLNE
jgi:capsular polysaccharide biosynthesis protein